MKCPIALIEVVGIHGGEGMLSVGGDGVVVRSGVGRRGYGVPTVVVVVFVMGGFGVVDMGRKDRIVRVKIVVCVLVLQPAWVMI